jgi:GNAT superfamily N-acetyltransferase
MTARIERLQPGAGARWRSIRLQALEEAPAAFGTRYGEALRWSGARWEAQVAEFATFVAVVEGRDVGVARGANHRNSVLRELISMWVAPAARRHGIGVQLIDTVADWARSEGASALVLDVVASNAPAIALYERTGFLRMDGARASDVAANEIRLVRSLTA